MSTRKIEYMELALELAKKAISHEDIPVGCVIVKDDKVIATSENRVEIDKDSTAHAELIAIKKAQSVVEYKHLLDCEMYITLEPCAMCAGAIVLSRIKNLYIATKDPKSGACGSVLNVVTNEQLNHRCEVEIGMLQFESSELLKDFFKKIRDRNERRN